MRLFIGKLSNAMDEDSIMTLKVVRLQIAARACLLCMTEEFKQQEVARSAKEMLALYCLANVGHHSRDDYICGHVEMLAQLLHTYTRVAHAVGEQFRSHSAKRAKGAPKPKGPRSSDDAIVPVEAPVSARLWLEQVSVWTYRITYINIY